MITRTTNARKSRERLRRMGSGKKRKRAVRAYQRGAGVALDCMGHAGGRCRQ